MEGCGERGAGVSLEQMLVENMVEALNAGYVIELRKRSDGVYVAELSTPGVSHGSCRATLFEAVAGAMRQANAE